MNQLFIKQAILRETLKNIGNALGPVEMEKLHIARVVFGLFFSGVKLSNGFGGVSYTLLRDKVQAVCCPSEARVMPNSGMLKGMPVSTALNEMFNDNPLKKTMGIAVMNALSNTIWSQQGFGDYEIVKDRDALDGVTLKDSDYVVLVGAFIPYLKVLKNRRKPFCVLEMNAAALKADEIPYFSPFEQAPEKVPLSDILIITGTTLINDTLEDLLKLAKPEGKIILVGPTASMLPDAFFRRGVKIMGGVMVTKPDELLDVLGEAGSGYHFFGQSADKMVIQPRHP